MTDNRISSLLVSVGMEDRSISQQSSMGKINILPFEYQVVEKFLMQKRVESYTYLADALEIRV